VIDFFTIGIFIIVFMIGMVIGYLIYSIKKDDSVEIYGDAQEHPSFHENIPKEK